MIPFQDPQGDVLVLSSAQFAGSVSPKRPTDSLAVVMRVDVDRPELARVCPRVIVAAVSDIDPTTERVTIGGYPNVGGLFAQRGLPMVHLSFDGECIEVCFGHDSAIGGLPGRHVDRGDSARIVDGCRTDRPPRVQPGWTLTFSGSRAILKVGEGVSVRIAEFESPASWCLGNGCEQLDAACSQSLGDRVDPAVVEAEHDLR